jgi:hypothetical protein
MINPFQRFSPISMKYQTCHKPHNIQSCVGNEANRLVTDRTEQGLVSSLIHDLRISAGSSQSGSQTTEFRTK